MLGSITEITGKEGNPLRSYSYDARGEMTSGETAHDVNPFRYVGACGVRWQDNTLGMYHTGARFYSPQVGRFTQRDPVTGRANLPQTYNKYVYALNSPTTIIDPSGKIAAYIAPALTLMVELWGAGYAACVVTASLDTKTFFNQGIQAGTPYNDKWVPACMGVQGC